jgi:hypothetical protein
VHACVSGKAAVRLCGACCGQVSLPMQYESCKPSISNRQQKRQSNKHLHHRPPPPPNSHTQTKAEYRRKAAILVELMSAQRNEAGTASEAFMQQLSAFR